MVVWFLETSRDAWSFCFFFSSRRRHTRWNCDWSSDVCSSDLPAKLAVKFEQGNACQYACGGVHILGPYSELVDWPGEAPGFRGRLGEHIELFRSRCDLPNPVIAALLIVV